MSKELETIKADIKTLRRDVDKLLAYANVASSMVKRMTGKNIDEMVKKETEINQSK